MDKYNWEMDEKTLNIYKNLERQIDRVFRHTRQGSYETRYRYKDGVKHFAKFMAETYKKQNLTKIENKHLAAYIEQMMECGYSNSYITTNLSAIRFFTDQYKDSSYIKSNKELGAISRGKDERIGPDRSWEYEEIKKMQELAIIEGQNRIADMIQIAVDHGFRIHEVIRLERVDLQKGLKEGSIKIKGKGGLVRKVPVQNRAHIEKLVEETPVRQAKIFVYENEKGHQVIEMVQQFIYSNRDKVRINEDEERGALTFHGLRHTYAQNRYQELRHNGKSAEEARKQVSLELGHFRVEITDIYLESRKKETVGDEKERGDEDDERK